MHEDSGSSQKVLAVEGGYVGLLALTFGLLPLCSGLSFGGKRELPMVQASVSVSAYINTLLLIVGCWWAALTTEIGPVMDICSNTVYKLLS